MPDSIRAARRAVDAIRGVELLEDGVWERTIRRWIFRYRITVEVPANPYVPSASEWIVHVSNNYPWGEIELFPTADGQFKATFQHQRPNLESRAGLEWRRGAICVRPASRGVDTRGSETEPFSVEQRMAWQLERAKEWLTDASKNQLVADGDPFELPDYAPTPLHLLAFLEGPEMLANWLQAPRSGNVFVRGMPEQTRSQVITRFHHSNGDVHLQWGTAFREATTVEDQGSWVRLDRPPFVQPWAAPRTWGELKTAVGDQGLDLLELLNGHHRLRPTHEQLLLVGFPIPKLVGQPPQRLHWLALQLPKVKKKDLNLKPPSQWGARADQARLDEVRLTYVRCENWHDEELLIRGGLERTIRAKRFLLVGAGALGSLAAECLVRAGVRNLLVVDGDSVAAGNLVRHTLDTRDVGLPKAARLARHLNRISPHVEAAAIDSDFSDAEATQEMLTAEVVLDCSGENDVLIEFSRAPWRQATTFISLSVGWAARRLITVDVTATVFPGDQVIEMLQPVMAEELAARGAERPPREGAGCWSVVFPARHDALAMAASRAVEQITLAISSPSATPRLHLVEPQWTQSSLTTPTLP